MDTLRKPPLPTPMFNSPPKRQVEPSGFSPPKIWSQIWVQVLHLTTFRLNPPLSSSTPFGLLVKGIHCLVKNRGKFDSYMFNKKPSPFFAGHKLHPSGIGIEVTGRTHPTSSFVKCCISPMTNDGILNHMGAHRKFSKV